MAERILQVGVKAVIQDDQGRILLLQRSEPFHGEDFLRWDIPGGRIRLEETQMQALTREVREETGLDLVDIERVFHVQDILHNPKLHVVRITYVVKATGTVRISEEHTQFQWMRPAGVPPALTDKFFIEALEAADAL